MNPTIELIDNRQSTRVYSDEPITAEEKQTVLHSAMRAPTAGNLMLYSIIEVEDQTLKDRLAITCDDQPFIAKAPWVLLFLADFQKWMDLFDHGDVKAIEDVEHRPDLGAGDLLLACSDALIAAQNAVIAAESLGIGSCYIGDILENAEEHARLFDLPRYVLPIAMLCLGRPKARRSPVPRQEKHVVMRDHYHRLTPEESVEVMDSLTQNLAPNGFRPGIANFAQSVYARKFATPYMKEMNRSARWWLERWFPEA